jgi:branched-subunit amino acid aminotransferase/4-amino-4-deoxychorismate lyase
MAAGPLPPPFGATGAVMTRRILVDPEDPLARHKTLNYWGRRIEHARALERGDDEVLCVTPDGTVCEATRFNLFLVEGGRLRTPGTDGPLLPGVMRRVVLDRAPLLGLDSAEERVSWKSLKRADEAFLTNSVRGILPIARLLGAELPAPGPVTRQLWCEILPWLENGGTTP